MDPITRGRASRRWGLVACAILIVAVAGWDLHRRHLQTRLLSAWPENAVADPALLRYALDRAPAVYAAHCATCHGADLQGDTRLGTPDLADAYWLYGTGQLSEIEDTVRYGIRSGHPKARNITDMPAFGRSHQLAPPEVRDVVEYVYSLSHKDADPAAAQRGRALFMDKGNCYDCHGADASGNVDYGAPDLTGHSGWLYGGDRDTLVRSVRDGRHGLCPAWGDTLTPAQVREVAMYLYSAALRAAATPHTGS